MFIIPKRVIVAGDAFYKSVQDIINFKVLGTDILYPEYKLSLRVASRKLFKFYIHYEYTEPFKIIRYFDLFYPAFTLFRTKFVKKPSLHNLVVGSNCPYI